MTIEPITQLVDHEACHHATHRQYRMTCLDYEDLYSRAGGRCEICRNRDHARGRRLHIDHDDQRGLWAVRGLLCAPCNTGLDLLPHGQRISYLANPWVDERYGTLTEQLPEPPPRTTVWASVPCRRWRRLWGRWRSYDGYRDRTYSWSQLNYFYGPHRLDFPGIPVRPVDLPARSTDSKRQ